MPKRRKWPTILVCALITVRQQAIPQSPDNWAPNPQLPLGIWELADQKGAAIGINLWRVPASMGHGGPLLKKGEKDYPVLQIGVYQRVKAHVRCGEENFFDAGWRGPMYGTTTSYQHQVLEIHSPSHTSFDPPIDVKLTFEPQEDVWRGRFHRGTFDQIVTLTRAPYRQTHDQELCIGPQETNFPPR
jgi:hypothetical protein